MGRSGESTLPQVNKTILVEIQRKREKMIDLAQEKGLTSDDTIKCSQELDQLIYQYQASFRKTNKHIAIVKNRIKQMIVWSSKAVQ